MRYLLITPSPARRIGPDRFALESAYVAHLRELKGLLGPSFTEVVLALPEMSEASYSRQSTGMTVVNESQEGIRLVTTYPGDCGKLGFLIRYPALLRQAWTLTRQADLVHSYFCYDLYRPLGFWFCLFGKLLKKPVMAVEDIDRRRDADMNLQLGLWSRRTHFICKRVYDPVRELLYHAYVRLVDLMLFKEVKQVQDYGKGAGHVRLFLDPNFSAEQVVDDSFVQAKLRSLEDEQRPLRLLYFGRLVSYKGVSQMIQAFALALGRGSKLTLDIMGAGPQREELGELARQLGVDKQISWIEPRPYGPAFFEVLRERDILLACPLSGDTPRSAWDALASGMPLVAFDTPFYKSMAEFSGAVETTAWPEIEPLADKLACLAGDKKRLAPLVIAAVETARVNTGELWMQRRNAWVQELLNRSHPCQTAAEPVKDAQARSGDQAPTS